MLASARSALFGRLLQQPGADSADFADILDEIQALLAGPITDDEGNQARAVPGEGADLELWVLGSSGGQSARVAGARYFGVKGLCYAAVAGGTLYVALVLWNNARLLRSFTILEAVPEP